MGQFSGRRPFECNNTGSQKPELTKAPTLIT